MQGVAKSVRYAMPAVDSHRSRWRNDPLWTVLQQQLTGDLFEMTSGAEPGRVLAVIRRHHEAMFTANLAGSLITLSHLRGDPADDTDSAVAHVAAAVRGLAVGKPEVYAAKRKRAEKRYLFL